MISSLVCVKRMANEPTAPFRVMMWCVPRCLSTALTKCFSFIDTKNTEVFFEPFCLRYLQECKARQKGWYPDLAEGEKLDVDTYLSTNYAKLKGTALGWEFNPDHVDKSLVTCEDIANELRNVPSDRSVFVKDIALGITGNYHHLPKRESGFKYTFVIRDPERVYPSYRNLLYHQLPITFDIDLDFETFDFFTDTPYMYEGYFYKCQYDLWKFVKTNIDPDPVVIDCEDILAHPADVLSKYLKACGMPWKERLLSWDPSPRIADTWRVIYPLTNTCNVTDIDNPNAIVDCAHAGTLGTSGFLPSKHKIPPSEMTPDVIRAIEATKGFYEEMSATKIRPSHNSSSDIV